MTSFIEVKKQRLVLLWHGHGWATWCGEWDEVWELRGGLRFEVYCYSSIIVGQFNLACCGRFAEERCKSSIKLINMNIDIL